MANVDLITVAIAAISLILLIMIFVTRSVVAALVIVGTVVLSLGASFRTVSAHLAAPARHPALLDRAGAGRHHPAGGGLGLQPSGDLPVQEEIGAGLNTGLIRTMAGTGSVVTAAGLVFAFTMCGFAFRGPHGVGPDRHHDRRRTDLRHPGRAVVHDAVDRSPARPLVLVAAEGASAAGQQHAAPYGTRRSVRELLRDNEVSSQTRYIPRSANRRPGRNNQTSTGGYDGRPGRNKPADTTGGPPTRGLPGTRAWSIL